MKSIIKLMKSARSGLAIALLLGLLAAPSADADFYWLSTTGTSSPRTFIGCASQDGSRVNNELIATAGGLSFNESVSDLALDRNHIYWSTNANTIARANLDGSGVNSAFISTGGTYPAGIAVDSQHVYWMDPFTSEYVPSDLGASYSGRIGRASLDGSGVNPDFIRRPFSFGGPGYDIAVDSAHIYFSDGESIARTNLDGTGLQSAPTGSPFIGSLQNHNSDRYPGAIAASQDHLYWTNYNIARANIDGSGVNENFVDFNSGNSLNSNDDLAVDSSHLYWTADGYTGNQYFNGIRVAGLDGTGSTLIGNYTADNPYFIQRFAVDGSTTGSCPPPRAGGGGGGGGGDLPAPVQGKSVNVRVISGTVLIKRPGGGGFVPLEGAAQIPTGSILDLRDGRIELVSSAKGNKTRSAEFYGGQVKVTQGAKEGAYTELKLVGPLEGCSKKRQPRRGGKGGRGVWGEGGGGHTSSGKKSSASVRGTWWLVEDLCNGKTRTFVKQGKVQVRDFERKRTITLRKGESYLAPGPKS